MNEKLIEYIQRRVDDVLESEFYFSHMFGKKNELIEAFFDNHTFNLHQLNDLVPLFDEAVEEGYFVFCGLNHLTHGKMYRFTQKGKEFFNFLFLL